MLHSYPTKIPVALALWNQVGSECMLFFYQRYIRSSSGYITAVLLIRTYAFFNRNIFILAAMIFALGGVIAYQLYVATSQMLRTWFFPRNSSGPFANPPASSSICDPSLCEQFRK